MKKSYIASATILVLIGLSTSACSSQNSTSTTPSTRSSKIVKKKTKKVKKYSVKKNTKKQNKAVSNNNSQSKNSQPVQNKQTAVQQSQNNNQQTQQPQRQLTQGEINRQRGYDPNGAPLLPGQDHAAGANPDGTPDAWVQGQVNWARRNGLINADGTPTQKARDEQVQIDNDTFGEDIPQVPNP